MNQSRQCSNFRFLIWIGLSLVLTACDGGSTSSDTTEPATIPEINAATVGRFLSDFKQDYDDSLNTLLQQFESAQKIDDAYSFVDFRNNKWTPAYINNKNFYAAVFEHNENYLKSSPIAPLFDSFDSLIYTGINLKNGLLNNDKGLIDQTLAEAKADQELVHSIVAATK
ncbi:MAG: hypothetical protein IBX57_04525 [Gammaproteobacteria bacterium]|nr:hypothetical protein [Gammaproteobacteria bacterium]